MPVKTIAMKKLKGTKRTFYCDDGCRHEYVDFYPAELVEKIIADLSNQVLEGRRKWNSLFFRSQLRRRELWDKRHAAVTEKDKELRHANYKLCLAMTRWCEAEVRNIRRTPLCDMDDHEIWQHDDEFWQRWHTRWFKIAEQFKEAQVMCEYCEGEEPKAIVSDPYNVLMIQGSELYFLSREGEGDYELSGKINFCPMCGRKLTEDK